MHKLARLEQIHGMLYLARWIPISFAIAIWAIATTKYIGLGIPTIAYLDMRGFIALNG